MIEADARLKDLFAEDEPPARDPAFSTAVMERIVRRRFLADVAGLAGVTALGGLVLWAVWPFLAPALMELGPGLGPVVAGLTLAVTVVLVMEGRVAAAAR